MLTAAAAAAQLFGLWLALALLLLSGIFRGVSTFKSEYLMYPTLYYPLVVLPELLSAILLSAPFFAAQTGLAGRMEEWVAQGRKPLPAYDAAAGGGTAGGGSQASADAVVSRGLGEV